MKTCKTCLYRDKRKSNEYENLCIYLSQPFEKTGIQGWPICEHNGAAIRFEVSENFGCIHHKEK